MCAHRCHRPGEQCCVSAASRLNTRDSLLKLHPQPSVGTRSHRHRRKNQRKGREGEAWSGGVFGQDPQAQFGAPLMGTCTRLLCSSLLFPTLGDHLRLPSRIPSPLPAFFALPPCRVPAPLPLSWLLWAAATSPAREMGRERAGRCSFGATDLSSPGALSSRRRSRLLATP